MVSLKKHMKLGIGNKLSISAFLVIGLVFAGLVVLVSYNLRQALEYRMGRDLMRRLEIVTTMLKATDGDLRARTSDRAAAFIKEMGGPVKVDREKALVVNGAKTHEMTAQGVVINDNAELVDRYSKQPGTTVSIMVREGDDFVRIASSLKDEKGARAVGSKLDKESAGHKELLDGKSYHGTFDASGSRYIIAMDPIKDGTGAVIGAVVVGEDFSASRRMAQEAIGSLKILKSGYYSVIDTSVGEKQGTLLVHPERKGTNGLALLDADGKSFIKSILDQKKGSITYPVKGNGGETNKMFTYFNEFKEWNWSVAATVDVAEFLSEADAMRNDFIVACSGALLLLSVMLYFAIRWMVSKPLNVACAAAQKIATGDLTVRIDNKRADEVGKLFDSVNKIGSGISSLVNGVRVSAESIANATTEIANANTNLATRTEQQASALVETSASAEQLGATARNNAESAKQADGLSKDASTVASSGGEVVSQVVERMESISGSSKKMSEIAKIIENIAFQTNILALNAAVEAARAGDQGKGFAVVASEVRNLAGRSAQAAKEIGVLINSSVDEIQKGGVLASQAGKTMQEVVESIHRVTDIMSEISTASAEQESGVTQVSAAVAQMDSATQQNSALVEEMATAAANLENQAQDLVKAVSAFKV